MTNATALRLNQDLFGSIEEASPMFALADSGEPTLRQADRDLYCLIRSDILLVDLSTAGYGEQGIDVLFGHVGGMPIIGITDRFQNAPALLSRLDCLIAPTNVRQIVHVLELFGGRIKGPASSESANAAPSTPATPSISEGFADQVLRQAGIGREVDGDGDGQDQVP